MKKSFLFAFVCFGLIGCSHGDYIEKRKKAGSFEKLLENSTGQDHTAVKIDSNVKNYVVYKNEVTGEYTAYNLAKFDRKTMTSLDQYLVGVTQGTDIVGSLAKSTVFEESGYNTSHTTSTCDSDGNCTYTIWEEWIDTSGYVNYYSNGSFKFDNANTGTKDLELVAYLSDTAVEEFVTQRLQSQFSLSANRATELSKLFSKFRKLENIRELTDDEKNVFAKDATGMSMKDIEKAMKQKAQGNEDAYKDFLKKAASVNKTTSENIGTFFEQYILN